MPLSSDYININSIPGSLDLMNKMFGRVIPSKILISSIQSFSKMKIKDSLKILYDLFQTYNKSTFSEQDRAITRLNQLKVHKLLDPITSHGDLYDYADIGGGSGYIAEEISKHLMLESALIIEKKDGWFDSCMTTQSSFVDYLYVDESTSGGVFDILPDSSLSLITCFQAFHHMSCDELNDILKQCKRVLKTNGKLLIREHDTTGQNMNNLIDLEHILYENVIEKVTDPNALKFEEYAGNYKSRFDWTKLLKSYGFRLSKNINPSEFKNNPTRYFYALFTK